MSEEYRDIFENWIAANGDYPHLKYKSFGGNYLHDEVAMKWDGFKLGINSLRQEVERLREVLGYYASTSGDLGFRARQALAPQIEGK